MAEHRPERDYEIVHAARHWLKKPVADLTVDELNLLQAYIAAEKRLKRVDEFIGSLR